MPQEVSMERRVFKLPFTKSNVSKYQCPTCSKGFLKIQEDAFYQRETKSSLANHDHPEFGHEWVEYIYSCIFECTNTACKEVVSSSGTGWVEEDYFYNEEGIPDRDYEDYFRPQIFVPHLKAFDFPSGTPEDVENEINKSFSLIFLDPASSANHIRVALEHLLTHLKIKRFNRSGGKRHFLSLHKRIELLPQKYDQIKDIFLAVKWLGNAGSHSNHEVTLDDVLDSYELTVELLDEIFSKKRTRAKSLAKKINKKKGPK